MFSFNKKKKKSKESKDAVEKSPRQNRARQNDSDIDTERRLADSRTHVPPISSLASISPPVPAYETRRGYSCARYPDKDGQPGLSSPRESKNNIDSGPPRTSESEAKNSTDPRPPRAFERGLGNSTDPRPYRVGERVVDRRQFPAQGDRPYPTRESAEQNLLREAQKGAAGERGTSRQSRKGYDIAIPASRIPRQIASGVRSDRYASEWEDRTDQDEAVIDAIRDDESVQLSWRAHADAEGQVFENRVELEKKKAEYSGENEAAVQSSWTR